MTQPPAQPKIYHITHVDNLSSIVEDGHIACDSEIRARGGPSKSIGILDIKNNRLGLPVKCHLGDSVGDYVPFNFCPRSVMLYVIYCANHPELRYRGGQRPIIHLESDLHEVIAWASDVGRRWAFTDRNAGTRYAQFTSEVDELNFIDWAAVAASNFRSREVLEYKQAECLVHGSFPWSLVARIGVRTTRIRDQVDAIIEDSEHRPSVEILQEWYY